jgi:hypothetical protein
VMDGASVRLHEALIRLAKGMISAWEEWLTSRKTNPIRQTTRTT